MAKHRSFKLEKFIKGVNNDLLKAYFTRQNIPVAEGFVFSIDNIHDFLDGIADDGLRSYVEEELHCINDIADRARNYLERAIRDYSIEVQDDEPSETTAMRVFLHSEEAFLLAYDFYLFVVYSDKLSHHKFENNNYNFDEDHVARLKSAIELHFKDTGKSEHCDVRWRSHGDRHVVLIAHGDFMKTHLIFEKGKVEIKSFRPAKEDMLVFDSNNCVLSINTSGYGVLIKKSILKYLVTLFLGWIRLMNQHLITRWLFLILSRMGLLIIQAMMTLSLFV